MRSGHFIRALGRRSFEPSDPTSRPDSTRSLSLQRATVRAENDVLATVGVCLRTPPPPPLGPPPSPHSTTQNENAAGLVIGACDLTITYLATWPLIGIRNRLQTYRVSEGATYVEVVKLAWRTGTLREHWAGMPSHLVWQLASANLGDFASEAVVGWLLRLKVFGGGERRLRHERWLQVVDLGMQFTTWVLLYPLFYHSNLQTLHLIAPAPIYPSLGSFIPFSAASPLSAPVLAGPLFSLATIRDLSWQALTSHCLQAFILQGVSLSLQHHLFNYLLTILPGPTPRDILDFPAPALEPPLRTHLPADFAFADNADATPDPGLYDDDASRPVPLSPRVPSPDDPAVNFALDPPPPRVQRLRRDIGLTTLATHPVDIAATHMADAVATALTLVAETAVMRGLARGVMREGGVGGKVLDFMVPRPLEWSGVGTVARAVVVGEWAVMWALFEVSWGVSSVVGRRWFGYGSR